jgi:hypothetical protein
VRTLVLADCGSLSGISYFLVEGEVRHSPVGLYRWNRFMIIQDKFGLILRALPCSFIRVSWRCFQYSPTAMPLLAAKTEVVAARSHCLLLLVSNLFSRRCQIRSREGVDSFHREEARERLSRFTSANGRALLRLPLCSFAAV